MGVLVRTGCGRIGTAYQKAGMLYRSEVRKFPYGRKKNEKLEITVQTQMRFT